MITQEQIKSIAGRIVENINPEKIILFGSYADGKPNEDSDIDLLIVQDTDKPINKRALEVRRCLRGLKIPMDILVYTSDEFKDQLASKYSFISSITEKGIVLYG